MIKWLKHKLSIVMVKHKKCNKYMVYNRLTIWWWAGWWVDLTIELLGTVWLAKLFRRSVLCRRKGLPLSLSSGSHADLLSKNVGRGDTKRTIRMAHTLSRGPSKLRPNWLLSYCCRAASSSSSSLRDGGWLFVTQRVDEEVRRRFDWKCAQSRYSYIWNFGKIKC